MGVREEALRLYGLGYSPLPDKYGKKEPINGLFGWQKFCHEQPPLDKVEHWFNPERGDRNISLAMGNGLVALDLDNDVDGMHRQILEILGEYEPIVKRRAGSSKFTIFFKGDGNEKTRVWKKNGVVVAELLAGGKKTTIPPSMHPDGDSYLWDSRKLGEAEPTGWNFQKEGKIDRLFGVDRTKKVIRSYDGEINDKEVDRALTYVDDDYYTWVEVGMALQQHYGDKGYGVWEKWSSKGNGFNSNECKTKWRSFGGSNNGITIATLFYHAKASGFNPKIDRQKDDDGSTGIVGCPLFDTLKEGDTLKDGFPKSLLEGEGLVYDVAAWINESSIYHQPILAFSAAIAVVATIKAKLIRSPSYCYTNMYMLNVAHSGTGKDHSRKCCDSLLRSLGMGSCIGRKPASGTAMIDSLYLAGGKQLLNIDEFGLWLQMVSSNNGSAFMKEIISVAMEMYSTTGSVFTGKSYAMQNGKKIEGREIDNPVMSILGTTTPSALFESLGSRDAINGFLNRFLLMESEEVDPVLNEDGGWTKPPTALVEKIEEFVGGYETEDLIHIEAKELPYSTKAKDILREFTKRVNSKRLEEIEKKSDLDAVWVRAREHAIKLSLVFSDGREIDEVAMQRGCDLAYYSSQRMLDTVKNCIYDNQWGKEYGEVLKKIPRDGIAHRNLYKLFSRKMDSKRFSSIIGSILEGGDARECDVNGGDLEHGKARFYRTD